MPGSKPGERRGGRKKGSRNKRTEKLEAQVRKVIADIGALIPNSFEGDGHAFMVAVYKDPRLPVDLRLDAAGKAARFEKPVLQAIEHSGNPDKPVHQVTRIERVIRRPEDEPEDTDGAGV